MKKILMVLAASGCFVLKIGSQPQAGDIKRLDPAVNELVPADASLEKVAGGFVFIEGPLWVPSGGYLLFSDVPGNKTYKWTPDGKVTAIREQVFTGEHAPGQYVGSNGLALDKQGRVLMCEHGNRRIVRMDKDGSIHTVVDKFDGKRLNSPNDLVFKSNGDLYFSDPPYGLPKGDSDPAKELNFNGVFRLKENGQLDAIVKDLATPNGVEFSPDEKLMYVADTVKKVWMVYQVAPDGTVSNGKVFADVSKERGPGQPDGFKVDAKGDLFCAGPGGIWIFSPDGKHLGTIPVPETAANLNWGDSDRKTLYITASRNLYRIKLAVAGSKAY